MNRVELDPKDNRSIYINGVKVGEVEEFRFDLTDGITVRFKGELGIYDELSH